MVFIQFATKEARKLIRKDRPGERPYCDALENYLSPAQEIEIFCTTQEREDFEIDHKECTIDADVIAQPDVFAKLIAYLRDCDLKRI